jgi:hypothetical protein
MHVCDICIHTYIHKYIYTYTQVRWKVNFSLGTPWRCTRSEATGPFINLGTRWRLNGQLHVPAVLLLSKDVLIFAKHRTTIRWTVPWLGRLVAGFSPLRSGFNPRPVHEQFLVEKVALGQVFLPVFRLCSVYIISPMLQTN